MRVRRSTLLLGLLFGLPLLIWLGWALRGADGGTRRAVAEAEEPVRSSDAPDPPSNPRPASGERRAAAAPAPKETISPDPAAATVELALVGRIVDPDGQPVAGTRILAAHATEWGSVPLDVRPRDTEMERWRRLETATDDEGRFQLRDLRPGLTHLAVRAERFAPLDRTGLALPERGTHDLGELVLEPGLALRGRVVSADGTGVPGARLARKAPSSGWGGDRYVELTTTDESGAFLTPALSPGEWTIRVESAAFPTGFFEGADYAAGVSGDHVFRLEASWSIAGRLEVPGVEDLTGYSVSLKFKGDAEALPDLRQEHRWQTADCAPDGSFSFPRVRAVDGTTLYELQPRRDSGRLELRVGPAVEVFAGDRDVILVAEALAALTFELRSQGEPIEEPWVQLVVGGGNHVDLSARGSVLALGAGRYRIPDLEYPSQAGSFALRIHKEGYRDLFRTDLRLEAGIERDLGLLELEPATLVDVRVVDAETGEPVEGAEVKRESADAPYFSRVLGEAASGHFDVKTVSATTDAQGRAQLPLALGYINQLGAFHPNYAPAVSDPFSQRNGPPEEIALGLGRGATLRVRLEDRQGGPVAAEGVACELTGLGERMRAFNSWNRQTQRYATTDASGVATFAHLPPGTTKVTHGRDGHGELLELVEGEERELVFVVELRTRLEVVVLEAGEPLVGAQLGLRIAEELNEQGQLVPYWHATEVVSAKTGASGHVLFEDVEVGDYDLVLRHGARALEDVRRVRVEPSGAPLVIDLSIAGIEGRVRSAGGEPIPACQVYALPRVRVAADTFDLLFGGADAESLAMSLGIGFTRTDAQGSFALQCLPAETSLVVAAVSTGSQLVLSEPFTLRGSETRRLAPLVAEPAAALTVRFEGESTDFFGPAVQLEFLDAPGELLTERRGGFGRAREARFDHLAPGTWRVRLWRHFGSEELLAEGSLRIAAGEAAELGLRTGDRR